MESKPKQTRKRKPKGLGDTVENVLKATGIDKIAKFVLGEDCNCDKRKEKLNKMFRYKQPLCLNEEEYNWIKNDLKLATKKISASKRMQQIHARIFNNNKLEYTSCNSCLLDIYNDLSKLVKLYEDENN
jgi:hypothetical protein